MNTEFRNKILNRYVEHAETETTQEQQAFLQAREQVDNVYPKAFELAKAVVSRAYPSEDVATCKTLKQKYGQPLDVVAKDKCFYFSYAKDELTEDEDERDRKVSEHFDFGLFGSLDNSDYSGTPASSRITTSSVYNLYIIILTTWSCEAVPGQRGQCLEHTGGRNSA